MAEPILIAQRGVAPQPVNECRLLPAMTNRHGLITGATGTGKTVSLQRLAESFSLRGVPVFLADVKGDLTGITQPGTVSAKLAATLAERGIALPTPAACPALLWDVFATPQAAQGHPVRAIISNMGPLLLARMLALNDTQQGVLQLVFRIADDRGLLLLDLKDLRAMLQYVGDNASSFTTEYGNVSAASIGAIQRGLLQIDSQGGDRFFGEPMLDIVDFLQTVGVATQQRGIVNILAADQLLTRPRLYATFLLWLLSELFERLPEVGDLDQPRLVFFFDEAHLLFTDAPTALVERIELVVRLVRSKGVGVWFVTQNPADLPDKVLAQLGNRIQHALRAYTPRDQKAVKAAASTMRPNPGLDIQAAITELAVGEALVSLLDARGTPSPTERVFVLPPGSRIGPISAEERAVLIRESLVAGVYERAVDRDSAYEKLKGRVAAGPNSPAAAAASGTEAQTSNGAAGDASSDLRNGLPTGPPSPASAAGVPLPTSTAATALPARLPPIGTASMPGGPGAVDGGGGGLLDSLKGVLFGSTGPRGGHHEGIAESAARSAMRSIGSSVGREIVRGVLGNLLGGKR